MQPIIFYFDDEAVLLTMFAEMFGEEYEVRTASTLAEARRKISECSPAVIITDLSMPEISGIEFLREVARICPESFRVLITGYGQIGELIGEISSGVVQMFLTKPWTEIEMRQMLLRATVKSPDVRRAVS